MCVLRCLGDLKKNNNKRRYHVLSNLLRMYDRDEFEKWKKHHQSAIIRACGMYFWNSKNAKAGVLGSNEANFVILRDQILSSSSCLVCMSNFGDLELNSVEQVRTIDKLLREISSSSEQEIRVFVLGAHDHWITLVLEKRNNSVQIVLIESENKRSVDTPASNDRKKEIQRIVKLLLDSSQGLTSVARFAMTHAVQKFIKRFNECVKRRKDGSLVARSSDGDSLEHFAAVRGGMQSLRTLRSRWQLFRSSNKSLVESSVRIEFVKLLRDTIRCVGVVKAPSFGRSISKHGRPLPSLRCPTDGTLWIEKYVNEVKMFLESLGSLSKEDERLISELDFGPKVYPIERAKRLQPKFVGVSATEILELLVAFEGRYTDDEVAAELRRELSLRPRCSKGHELRPAMRNGNFCDLCNANGKRKNERGTSFRCSRGCDFDACTKCWNLHGRGDVVRCVLRSLRNEISRDTDAVYPSVRKALNFRIQNPEDEDTKKKEEKVLEDAKQLRSIFPDLTLSVCMDAIKSSRDLNAAVMRLLSKR